MNGLEADVVRVPLIRGPKATKEILSSAIDIMNGVDMELLQKRQIADSVLSELAKTIVLEKVCLIECGDLLAATLLQWSLLCIIFSATWKRASRWCEGQFFCEWQNFHRHL
ncbi:hypothetical protein GOP47_0014229 [Adiantum capillus-veneris]|uniref:Uncharacterized protein n=1 Tax=Adiantum capillus-veneris TaxID=13818 RepID=A0A9D4ZDZ6_ADICA|nr:hypothetical protein GOP47_0014229 [Adiantum capillus-veneris]